MSTTTICRILPPESWDEEILALRTTVHPADFWMPGGPMAIADARAVSRFATTTPTNNSKLAVLPGADTWTLPVANALLKLIEEPPEYLKLVLLAASANLLDTISSRVRFEGTTQKFGDPWSTFLSSCTPVTPQSAERLRQLLFLQAITHVGHDAKRIVKSLHLT